MISCLRHYARRVRLDRRCSRSPDDRPRHDCRTMHSPLLEPLSLPRLRLNPFLLTMAQLQLMSVGAGVVLMECGQRHVVARLMAPCRRWPRDQRMTSKQTAAAFAISQEKILPCNTAARIFALENPLLREPLFYCPSPRRFYPRRERRPAALSVATQGLLIAVYSFLLIVKYDRHRLSPLSFFRYLFPLHQDRLQR